MFFVWQLCWSYWRCHKNKDCDDADDDNYDGDDDNDNSDDDDDCYNEEIDNTYNI